MVHASDIKIAMTLNIDERLYKVLEVIRHGGSGKMQGYIELKVLDMQFGHITDKKFKQTDKVEDVDLSRKQMDFLYSDGDAFYFMDPDTFEQYAVPAQTVGQLDKFLLEGMRVTIELVDDQPIGMDFPKTVELTVAMTGAPMHGGQDNTLKSAVLENGIEILVPQFIQSGDHVRVDTAKLKYVDRVTTKHI